MSHEYWNKNPLFSRWETVFHIASWHIYNRISSTNKYYVQVDELLHRTCLNFSWLCILSVHFDLKFFTMKEKLQTGHQTISTWTLNLYFCQQCFDRPHNMSCPNAGLFFGIFHKYCTIVLKTMEFSTKIHRLNCLFLSIHRHILLNVGAVFLNLKHQSKQ